MAAEDDSTGSTTYYARRYLVAIVLFVALIIVSIFWGFNFRSNEFFREQLLNEGRSLFQQIVITRSWMAQHGGVYVAIREGVEVNPYLKLVPGLKVTIRDEDGALYTLKNPALATREISKLANEKGIFKFNITSLKPLNKTNIADQFETEALQAFNNGVSEHYSFESTEKTKTFRYMAPLITEESCLKCHAIQGYRKGDVRGGISVTVPADKISQQMSENRTYLAVSALGIVIIVLFIIYFIANFFMKDLRSAEQKLVNMAIRDFLTGLLNRREGFRRIDSEISRANRRGEPLSAIMTDVDHFKKVNDNYGHLTGDIVLQSVAKMLEKTVRDYDILCRYGGEEFLIVTPMTNGEQAQGLAERIRKLAEEMVIPVEGQPDLKFTLSLGVSEFKPGEKIEVLISRADQALYEAKNSGRNKVCAA